MPNKNSIMPSWICSAPPTHDEEGIVHKPEGIVTFPIHSHCPGKGNYQLKQQRERETVFLSTEDLGFLGAFVSTMVSHLWWMPINHSAFC